MKQIKMNDWNEPDFGTYETGMTVPEGFFADFQKNLELKIDELEAQKAQRTAPTLPLEPQAAAGSHHILWWSIAASVALITGLFVWFSPREAAYNETLAGEAVTAEAISETSDLSESMMLASVSDYDIYEALYSEEL